MDAMQFQLSEEPVEVVIYDPKTQQETDMVFLVTSVEAEIPSAKRRQYTDRRFARMNKARGQVKLTADEIDTEALDILVACTKGWRNVGVGEETTEFSAEKCRQLYKQVKPIKEQIEEAINDRGLFTKKI